MLTSGMPLLKGGAAQNKTTDTDIWTFIEKVQLLLIYKIFQYLHTLCLLLRGLKTEGGRI